MTQRKQRGSGWSISFALNIYRVLGYKALYYFMYPVSFFYFLVAKNAKVGLRAYYEHLNSEFTNKVYFNHIRLFAVCLVDRFISKMNPKEYRFSYENREVPVKMLESGAILLYSHFGGWAASSNSAKVNNKINIVMKESMLEGIKKLEDKIDTESNLNVIDLDKGTLVVSIEIANALLNNEVVAIMADRASNAKAEYIMPFLGEDAKFNKNPFQVAYKVDKPILVYFIIWVDIQHYKVEYMRIDMDKSKDEEKAIATALTTYVHKLEEIVRAYPNQWFNLYDFWEKK